MKRTRVVAAVAMLVTAACGGGGRDNSALQAPTKTVDVNMMDIAFQPATVSAQRGERVEFVFHNEGKVAHDAFIGDSMAQADHERQMRQGDDGSMGGGHAMKDSDTGITVDPSCRTGSPKHRWTFEQCCKLSARPFINPSGVIIDHTPFCRPPP